MKPTKDGGKNSESEDEGSKYQIFEKNIKKEILLEIQQALIFHLKNELDLNTEIRQDLQELINKGIDLDEYNKLLQRVLTRKVFISLPHILII